MTAKPNKDRFMGAIIALPGTPYFIEKLDDLNWCLRRRYTVPEVNEKTGKPNARAGEECIENIYYYPTLGQACADIARYLADEADGDTIETLQDYADRLKRISNEVEDAANAITLEGKSRPRKGVAA